MSFNFFQFPIPSLTVLALDYPMILNSSFLSYSATTWLGITQVAHLTRTLHAARAHQAGGHGGAGGGNHYPHCPRGGHGFGHLHRGGQGVHPIPGRGRGKSSVLLRPRRGKRLPRPDSAGHVYIYYYISIYYLSILYIFTLSICIYIPMLSYIL